MAFRLWRSSFRSIRWLFYFINSWVPWVCWILAFSTKSSHRKPSLRIKTCAWSSVCSSSTRGHRGHSMEVRRQTSSRQPSINLTRTPKIGLDSQSRFSTGYALKGFSSISITPTKRQLGVIRQAPFRKLSSRSNISERLKNTIKTKIHAARSVEASCWLTEFRAYSDIPMIVLLSPCACLPYMCVCVRERVCVLICVRAFISCVLSLVCHTGMGLCRFAYITVA